MTLENLIISASALFAAVLLIERFILWSIRPVRMEMAELGRTLIESNIPDDEKRLVNLMLDDAFNWRFMISAVVHLPGTVRLTISRSRKSAAADRAADRLLDRPEGARFISLFQKSLMAANPLFTLLFVIEMVLVIIALILFGLGLQISLVILNAFVGRKRPNGDAGRGSMAH